MHVSFLSPSLKRPLLLSAAISIGLCHHPAFAQQVAAPAAAETAELSFEQIFTEPHLPGVRPQPSFFSPDGGHFYFTWNDSSHAERGLYRVPVGGGDWETVPEGFPRRFDTSPDGSRVLYTRDGDLMTASSRIGEDGLFEDERTLASPGARVGSYGWSPDGRHAAWQAGGEIWVMDLDGPAATRVAGEPEGGPSYSFTGWVGNDRLLLTRTDRSGNRTVYFPEYVDEFVQPGASSRGIPRVSWHVQHIDSASARLFQETNGWTSSDVSPSGRYVALDVTDDAMKHREIRVYDLLDDTTRVVFQDSTDGWMYGRSLAFAPEDDVLMFQSEQTGWNHVYTVYPEGSGLERHTDGAYDIPYAEWLDGQTLLLATTETDLGERQILTLNLRNGRTRALTSEEGYRYQFRLSPDRSTLVYAWTYFNRPYDLFSLDLERPRTETQLTRSVPEAFFQHDWQQERYVRFTGRDGETGLSMSILLPEGFDPEANAALPAAERQRFPTVVFVHGAGSLQNVYKGWSNNYWREYMFHQWLTRRGYAVVEVDYRHSTGYGRKFREDVTDWMGRYETEDIVDGLDWITANGDYVDRGRVGVYGGSYGGFMALYAATVEPDHFHAAAALRAVTNWRNYYHANPWYTLPRLGDPEVVPENYEKSSPLDRIDDLRRPVLILHGLVDDNVGFQDAAQYIEALIMAGDKEFDMMMYPSEPHGFVKPESWIDEYRRIYEFFERHL